MAMMVEKSFFFFSSVVRGRAALTCTDADFLCYLGFLSETKIPNILGL